MQKITVDAKWSANTRGEIEYDYIKDPGEYYQAHYKALYNYYLNAQGQTPDQAYVSANTNMIGTNSQTGGLSYNVYSYPEGEYLIGKNGLLNPNAKLGRIVNGYYLTPDNWLMPHTIQLYARNIMSIFPVEVTKRKSMLLSDI